MCSIPAVYLTYLSLWLLFHALNLIVSCKLLHFFLELLLLNRRLLFILQFLPAESDCFVPVFDDLILVERLALLEDSFIDRLNSPIGIVQNANFALRHCKLEDLLEIRIRGKILQELAVELLVLLGHKNLHDVLQLPLVGDLLGCQTHLLFQICQLGVPDLLLVWMTHECFGALQSLL